MADIITIGVIIVLSTIYGALTAICAIFLAFKFSHHFIKVSSYVPAPNRDTEDIPKNSQSVTYLTSAHEDQVLSSAQMEKQQEFNDGLE